MSIESAVLDVLKADSTLIALVSTFAGEPAIFTDVAPEKAEKPYIVCSFTKLSSSPEIGDFNLYIDYFDFSEYNKSHAPARNAMAQLDVLLDLVHLVDTEDEWSLIRSFSEGNGHVPAEDAREIHYNSQFTLRAGRRAWSENL